MSIQKLDQRFWEVDLLRGIAVLMMITFHLFFDLNYLGIASFNIQGGLLWFFGRLTASIFIFLVGASLKLSYMRTVLSRYKGLLILKYVKRGLRILSYGFIITFVTWLLIGNGYIIFGVLHFIGVAIILSYPLLRYEKLNIPLAILFIIMGLFLLNQRFDINYLFWLGVIPKDFYTLDYFPILPWMGVVSIGIYTAGKLYNDYKRRFPLRDFSSYKIIGFLAFIGRHSLFIYFIHQPIIMIILFMIKIF
ncbi:MAG: heparan-alpha-glucosaminide N-acetyltransferase [Methanothermobacter sp.]|nr:heparan-alpha-glucosaminide N-acetyltransferase [Methanothermobacter sp.]